MKKNISFLISFCFAKGIVFLAPLLLADTLTERDFGILEYSLAGVGMLLNAFINLGVSGAYPYFILRQKNTSISNGFVLHTIWLSLFFLVNQLLYFGFHLFSVELYMAVNISYIIANQQFFSAKLKSHENIIKAVFLDAGIYILLAFFVLGYYFDFIDTTIENISKAVFIYGLFFVLFAFINIIKVTKDEIFEKYKTIIRFSIHLLISSVFLFSLTVSGRVLAKHFFGYEEAGLYGFYYRLASIVVMIYQVVSIRYFKDLYTTAPKILDKYFSRFFIAIFLISIIVYIVSPYVVPYFSDYFAETIEESRVLFFIIFSQMTMWIATALNSSIIDREGMAKINNIYFLGIFLLGVLVLFIVKSYLTLVTLSFGIYTIFYITNLLQYLTLYKKKIIFKKASLTLTIIYAISCIILLILN